ncbi:ABC transporter substrate-binding protein [Candidatus Bipolaricaulota bacterium]|nr:ABC transporter substrate-binding protein [Candidatus Bipolaricaulota bacterium]
MRNWIAAAVVVLAFVGAAFAQEPIKIGALLEFTGGCAAYGKMAQRGLELARDEGLVPTEVLGRPIKLVYYDARTEPVEAANGATRLIETEGVVAIIGTMCSGPYLGAAEICQNAGVPFIGPTTTNPLTTQVGDCCFRACFKDNDQGPVAAYLAYQELGARRVAVVIDVAQAYCVGLGKYFSQAFKALGGQVVATLYCRTGDRDFTAQLTEIARANPDLIYTPNYYTEVALMARQARDLGLTQPILGADGCYAPELIEIGGEAVEGIQFTTFWHEEAASTEIGKRYAQVFREKFGKSPDAFGALAVDCYMLIVDAIQRAGEATPEAIKEALKTADLEVVTGRTIMTPEGDPLKDFVFLKVEGGKFVFSTIIPAEKAQEIKALMAKGEE